MSNKTNDEMKAAREQVWSGVPMQNALRDAVSGFATGYKYDELESDETLDADEERAEIDKQVNLLAHMFNYYAPRKLFDELETSKLNVQMYIVGGMVHSFTKSLPAGAGFAELTAENSDWQCLLVRRGAGYDDVRGAKIVLSDFNAG